MPYVTIDQALTDSPQFQGLTWNAGNVLLRLVCYPTAKSFGMIRASPGGLEDDFVGAIERDSIVECLDELQGAGFLRWERGSIALDMSLVTAPWPNLIKSWGRHLEEMRPGPVLEERCRELAALIDDRSRQESDPAKAKDWIKVLPDMIARHLPNAAKQPANDDGPNPSGKASGNPSGKASGNPSGKASGMPLRDTQDSGLRSQNSDSEAAIARAREGLPEVPENLAEVVGVALGRDPTAKDLEELATLIRSWGVERVTETAERVLARSVAENKPPSSVGLVRRCLRDGDPPEKSSGGNLRFYADHLRWSLEERGWFSDHPMFERLQVLVPLLTTEAGLNGAAQGLNRWGPRLQPVKWTAEGWLEVEPTEAQGYRVEDGRVFDVQGNEITVDQEEVA